MSNSPGRLFVVATPIGNLDDISSRAIQVLRSVDIILAEDTRHSANLLSRFEIRTRVSAYHEHNEAKMNDAITAENGGATRGHDFRG
jgi:16S rRNA (cytidine1402-2'-O)-methyltransferase